jgi:hypothetical protein
MAIPKTRKTTPLKEPVEQRRENDRPAISTLAELESQILIWQETCLRRFHPMDRETYLVRLLPVLLAGENFWLRYGQHWVGSEERRPLICPDTTDPAVLDETSACPLCRSLDGKHDDDRRASLSYLFYCLVLRQGGVPITGDRRFRLHQWWVTNRVCGIIFNLAEPASIFTWGKARALEVTCEDSRVSVEFVGETDPALPELVVQRVSEAAVSPKRRVPWRDLEYEALMCNVTSLLREGERWREY